MILQFVIDTFTPEWKLLSVLISGMSIPFENWGYNSDSWSDTHIKQFNNGINVTWTKTNLNNCYSVVLLHKISLISPLASTWQPFWANKILSSQLKPVSWLCSFSQTELKPNRTWENSPIVPNILPVNLVPENWGVYGWQSDKRRYTAIYSHCIFGISLAFCYTSDSLLSSFFDN